MFYSIRKLLPYLSYRLRKGYGDFKTAVGEAVCDELRPLREEYNRLISDKAYLAECMKEGAEKASYIAERTLKKAMKKVGFLQI